MNELVKRGRGRPKGIPNINKGKTFEEIHGLEEAIRLRECVADSNRRRKGLPNKSRGKPKPSTQRWWDSMPPEERKQRTFTWQVAGTKSVAALSKNRTKIEIAVEEALKELKVEYIAQHPIKPYVVDFYLPKENFIIECDGGYWHNRPGAKEHDEKRDNFILSKYGISSIRLPENLINLDAVQSVLLGFMCRTAWMQ